MKPFPFVRLAGKEKIVFGVEGRGGSEDSLKRKDSVRCKHLAKPPIYEEDLAKTFGTISTFDS